MFNKKVLVPVLVSSIAGMLLAANASAAVAGPYVGAQIGAGNVHQTIFGTDSNFNLAGRIDAGYQINQNFGVELGAAKYSNATGSAYPMGLKLNGKIQTFTVDLAAVGIIPIQSGFSLVGKLGAAYVNEKATASIPALAIPDYNETQHRILPEAAIGVSYDINQNVVTDVSWTHIQKVGNTDIQNLDFIGAGLSYHFG